MTNPTSQVPNVGTPQKLRDTSPWLQSAPLLPLRRRHTLTVSPARCSLYTFVFLSVAAFCAVLFVLGKVLFETIGEAHAPHVAHLHAPSSTTILPGGTVDPLSLPVIPLIDRNQRFDTQPTVWIELTKEAVWPRAGTKGRCGARCRFSRRCCGGTCRWGINTSRRTSNSLFRQLVCLSLSPFYPHVLAY